jgi:dihydropyrimidinase
MIDLIVQGGDVVTPDGIFQADVGVNGEHVIAIGDLPLHARRIIDAKGCYVLPGLVDSHVHMQCSSWNAVSPNDFYHGTVAAALGGVTTIIDFATQERGKTMMAAVEKLCGQADGNVVIDYGMHISITDVSPESLNEVETLIDYGVPSFKMFTTYRSHNLMLEDDQILDVCKRVRAFGGLPGAHCENNPIAESNYACFEREKKRAPRYHALAKPNYVEAEAVSRMLLLARVAQTPFYIYHLSTAEGVSLVRQARRAGQKVLAETCTHYLVLSKDDLDRPDGINYICSPPLRSTDDQQALWGALKDGTVSVISTDEAGFNAADKKMAASGPLDQVPNGIPGVEMRMAVVYSQGVEKGKLSLERFVAVNCANPARAFGLYPRKGVIAPGSDADIVVVNPAQRRTLSIENQNMVTDWCAYDGMDVAGYPAYTLSRGQVIVDNYRFVAERGRGVFIPGRLESRIQEMLW